MDFQVDRGDLTRCRTSDAVPATVGAGQVRLRVDAFACTSNNITYAVLGEAFGYWAAFPAEPPWGRIPAWGYAEVVVSNHAEVAVGTRVYGFVPMSAEMVVTPGHVDPAGFVDTAPHRSKLAGTYNRYSFVPSRSGVSPAPGDADGTAAASDAPDASETVGAADADVAGAADADTAGAIDAADREDLRMVLHPLFATAFLLEDHLTDNDAFGADSVILSSASSKTAMATAFQIQRRGGRHLVGLTSSGNREVVEDAGLYDHVLTYDEVPALPGTSACYLDVAGSAQVRRAVHEHFGAGLVSSLMIGAAHWQDRSAGDQDLPGAAPTLFFAPSQASKRVREWGLASLEERLASAWSGFATWSAGWMRFEHLHGAAAVEDTYLRLLRNDADPQVGAILTLAADAG